MPLMHITNTLKPLLGFEWRMKAVLIAKLTPVTIKVPALFFLLLLSFRLLPKEFLAHFILGFIVIFSSLLTFLQVLFQVLPWFDSFEGE